MMSDEEEDRSRELIDWDEDYLQEIAGKKPDAKYGALSEAVRHAIPEHRICSMFCGGKKCKYCNAPSYWKEDRMVINGLFSEWVTDNILATSRPSTDIMDKYQIIQQFKDNGIKSIINLQLPGEHASCGSGCINGEFSYDPQQFMDNDVFFYNFGWPDLSVPDNYYKVLDMCKVMQYAISEGKVALHCHAGKVFFYNFGWPDYGVGTLTNMLDMVKVMQFALSEGKAAIHCHAGLGRTGVLIGCYLVYANRMQPDDAVHYIRKKRAGAIQTRNQVGCIQEFSQFLQPLQVIFSGIGEHGAYDFSLTQFLTRQKHLLHGFEARKLKLLPKIVYECCNALHRLSGLTSSSTSSSVNESLDTIRASAPGAFNNVKSSHGSPGSLKTVQSSPTLSAQKPALKNRSIESFTAVELKKRSSEDKLSLQGGSDSDSGPLSAQLSYEGLPAHLSHDATLNCDHVHTVGLAMAQTEYSQSVIDRIDCYKLDLNDDPQRTWKNLEKEMNAEVVSGLLWAWLDHLKEPVLHPQDMPHMLEFSSDPISALSMLDKGCRCTVEHLISSLAILGDIPDAIESDILQRLLSTLTHQNMVLELDALLGAEHSLVKRTSNNTGLMRDTVANRLMLFFTNMLHQKRNQYQNINGGQGTSS